MGYKVDKNTEAIIYNTETGEEICRTKMVSYDPVDSYIDSKGEYILTKKKISRLKLIRELIKHKYYRHMWLKHFRKYLKFEDTKFTHAYKYHKDLSDYYWKLSLDYDLNYKNEW